MAQESRVFWTMYGRATGGRIMSTQILGRRQDRAWLKGKVDSLVTRGFRVGTGE